MFLFFLVWTNHINCKIHNPTSNPKALAVHPTVPFQSQDRCNCHPPYTSQILQNHWETTPIKYVLKYKLVISWLKEMTLTYGVSLSALYSEVRALIRK